jgi:hypothetical protein
MKKHGTKENRTIRKQIRFSLREFEMLKFLANAYAGGNVSRWLRYAATEAPRRKLKK